APAPTTPGVSRPIVPSLITGVVTVAVGLVCCVLLASNLLATLIGAVAGAVVAVILRRLMSGAVIPGVAIGVVILLPFAFPALMSVENATIALTFAIIAMSQYFITGLAGQMSLGQGALAAIGAYAFGVAHDNGVPWVPAIVIAGLAAMVVGMIVGLIALRL